MNARQLASGLGWSSAATLVNAVAQFVFLAVLARLLDPAAFGLVAMAGIVLRFSGFFAQLGMAQALIQKATLRPEDTTAALLLALALGACFYLATWLAAPLCARYFLAPELPGLLTVFGLSLVLGPVGGLPIALLRRQGRFKRISAIEVASFVLGYGGVGIAGALAGLGVWSLVAAVLAQQTLALVLGFATARFGLAWPLQGDAFRQLWRFGRAYSLIGFLEFLSANVEALFIGRSFGKVDLGVFNRAANLTNLPVEQAVNALNKVLFPAFAAMQSDRSRLADGFEMLLLCVGLLSTALACSIAAAAVDVVAWLLGRQWSAAAPLVALLAFATPPLFMYVVCGITLDSLGALGPKLRLQGAALAAKVVLVLGLAPWGLRGVALAVVTVEMLRWLAGMWLVGRALAMPARRCWRLVGVFVVEGLGVHAAVQLAAGATALAAWPLVARLICEAAAGALVCAFGLVLLWRQADGYAPLQRFESLRAWHGRLQRACGVGLSHS